MAVQERQEVSSVMKHHPPPHGLLSWYMGCHPSLFLQQGTAL